MVNYSEPIMFNIVVDIYDNDKHFQCASKFPKFSFNPNLSGFLKCPFTQDKVSSFLIPQKPRACTYG